MSVESENERQKNPKQILTEYTKVKIIIRFKLLKSMLT